MIQIDNTVYRNLEEQVRKNQNDIKGLSFGLNIVGKVDNIPDLPLEAKIGDAFLVGKESPFHICVKIGDPKDYVNIGTLESTVPGPQGKEGPEGPAGRGVAGIQINETGVMSVTYTDQEFVSLGSVIGPEGKRGVRGERGPEGPQGPKGEQGERGNDGISFRIIATLDRINQLPDPESMAFNTAYLVKEGAPDTTYNMYLTKGNVGNRLWVNIGPMHLDQDAINELYMLHSDLDTRVTNEIAKVNDKFPISMQDTDFIICEGKSLFKISDIVKSYGITVKDNKLIVTKNLNPYERCFVNVDGSTFKGVSNINLPAGKYYFSFYAKSNTDNDYVAIEFVNDAGQKTSAKLIGGKKFIQKDYLKFNYEVNLTEDYNKFGFMIQNDNIASIITMKNFWLNTTPQENKLDDGILLNTNSVYGTMGLAKQNAVYGTYEQYNAFDKNDIYYGRWNGDNGALNLNDATRYASRYIPVANLVSKTIHYPSAGYGTLAEFNAEKKFLRGCTFNYQNVKQDWVIHDDAAYIGLGCMIEDVDLVNIPAYRFKSLLKETPKHEKVLCIGDSLTAGVDTGEHIIPHNYPYYLEKDFGYEVKNLGKPGDTAQTWYNKWYGIIDVKRNYDIILIMLGTNGGLTDTIAADTASGDFNTYANTNTGCYCKLIERLMRDTDNKAQIILVMPPYHHYSDEKFEHLQSVRRVLPKIAERYGLPIIDTYLNTGMNAFNGAKFRPIDNLHLSAKGYHKLATYIGNQVKSMRNWFDLED